MDKYSEYYDVYMRELINLIEDTPKQAEILNDFINMGFDFTYLLIKRITEM